MQIDFYGQRHLQPFVPVRLYADEIKPYKTPTGERWMYIGLLAIPEKRYQDATEWLAQDRRAAGYEGEVHFTDLHNYSYAHGFNEKCLLARRWVERILWDSQKVFHFHLLGLNLYNLQHATFGVGKDQEHNIYKGTPIADFAT